MRRVLGTILILVELQPQNYKEPCLKNWPIHCHILDYEPSTLTLPQLLIRGDDYTVFCPTYDAEIFALSLPVQTFICKQEDRESSNLYHLDLPYTI